MKYDPKHDVILYYTQNPCNPFHAPLSHLLPFGQCIVEQTTLSLLNSLIVYCRVSSNFHFSFSIILCLVQKKWYVQKIPRGGWSGFGMALIWIDPNFHENCLDWSKLFLSLSKLYPNRRCSAILPLKIILLVLSYSRTPGHNVRSLVTNLHQGRFLISADLSRFPNERKTDAGLAVWTHWRFSK